MARRKELSGNRITDDQSRVLGSWGTLNYLNGAIERAQELYWTRVFGMISVVIKLYEHIERRVRWLFSTSSQNM